MLLDVDGAALLLVMMMMMMMMMIMMIIIIVITTATALESITRISFTSMQDSLLTNFHIILHYYVFFKLKVLVLFCT